MKKHLKILTTLLLFCSAFTQQTKAQDVAVNISGSVGATPGSKLTYKIYVSNNGTTTATNVNVQAPAVANFTASSVSCANGPGNGGSSTCPGSVTLTGLQGAGLTIPSLPSGSAVVFTVTGTAGASGDINYSATKTPEADGNTSNNTTHLTTGISSVTGCRQSVYTLNLAQTVSGNTVAPNGGTINLVYSLTSGTAIPGLGSSFTIPVTYSDFSNNYGTDNQWYDPLLNQGGVNLGMPTYNNESTTQTLLPGSVFSNLPASNIKASPGLLNPYGVGNLVVDGTMTQALRNGSVNPLGTFTLSFGNIALPSGTWIISESLILQGRGGTNSSQAGNQYIASMYWAKPMIQNGTETTIPSSTSLDTEMEFGQTYTWRYTAFITNGLQRVSSDRGVVFKSGSITFAHACPCNAGSAQVPLDTNILTN